MLQQFLLLASQDLDPGAMDVWSRYRLRDRKHGPHTYGRVG